MLGTYSGKVLSALDPGKQGLKLKGDKVIVTGRLLSALDPGKQGLKQTL